MTVLEKIGHYLDMENERLRAIHHQFGYNEKQITSMIGEKLDVKSILSKAPTTSTAAMRLAGLIGHGDAFVLRDPAGIRPCFWYADDEVVVVASERPAIQTAFNACSTEPSARTGTGPRPDREEGRQLHRRAASCSRWIKRSCSFERIYFSRGSDARRVPERIALGRSVCPAILETRWTTTWRTPCSPSSPTPPRWRATAC
jgi:amidophosphoribosyltransferase